MQLACHDIVEGSCCVSNAECPSLPYSKACFSIFQEMCIEISCCSRRSARMTYLHPSNCSRSNEDFVVGLCIGNQLLGVCFWNTLRNHRHNTDGRLLHRLHARLISTALVGKLLSRVGHQHIQSPKTGSENRFLHDYEWLALQSGLPCKMETTCERTRS